MCVTHYLMLPLVLHARCIHTVCDDYGCTLRHTKPYSNSFIIINLHNSLNSPLSLFNQNPINSLACDWFRINHHYHHRSIFSSWLITFDHFGSWSKIDWLSFVVDVIKSWITFHYLFKSVVSVLAYFSSYKLLLACISSFILYDQRLII